MSRTFNAADRASSRATPASPSRQAPGGHALLSFQVGEGHRHLSHAYGHDVSMEAHLFPPEMIAGHLTSAGFNVIAQMTRQARTHETTPQAVLLARRPAAGAEAP